MFFTYDQNNSGGSFDYEADRGISFYVIVEADSADEANNRAERIGLYFDGAGDCECCGNRWTDQWNDQNGTPYPEVYGRSVLLPEDDAYYEASESGWVKRDEYEGFVHYKDGRVLGFWRKNE